MIEKIVKSQKELDELIASNFDGLIIVKDTIEEIKIKENGKSLSEYFTESFSFSSKK